jgi:hypothetical protein
MIRVQAIPLRVIHWEYKPPPSQIMKFEFAFGHTIGRNQTGQINAIRLRLQCRSPKGKLYTFIYIAEQDFKFEIADIPNITFQEFESIVNESYQQFLKEYENRPPSSKPPLEIQFPDQQVLQTILNRLTDK